MKKNLGVLLFSALFAMSSVNAFSAEEKTDGTDEKETEKAKSLASVMPADDGVYFTLAEDPTFAHWSYRLSIGGSILDGDIYESSGHKLLPTSDYKVTAGLAIERSFNPIFGAAFQYNYIPYGAEEEHVTYKLDGTAHEGDFFLSVNMLNLFYHQRNQRWAWYVNCGLGVSFYKAEMKDKETGEIVNMQKSEMDLDDGWAFVIPLSTVVEYNINKLFAIGLKAEYRMHNKDNFEGSNLNTKKGNANDAFELLSLTFRHKIHFKEDYHVRNMTYSENDVKGEKALNRKIAELEAKLADLEAKDTCCNLAAKAMDKVADLESKIDSIQRPDTIVLAKETERVVPKIVKDTVRIKEVILDPTLDKDGDGVADADDRCPELKGDPDNFGCPKIKEKARRAFNRALRGIQFETNRAVIKPVSYEILQEVVNILKEFPDYEVEIIGHTDNRGGAEYNLDLSKKRAESVAKFLENNGIAKNRIKTNGYGLSKPVASNETVEGRALNRRVEFVVTENGSTKFDTEKNEKK